MTGRAKDRRRNSGALVTRPPSSPANLLVLTVVGLLGMTAAAGAFMNRGFEDVTPHGQLLGELQAVAHAQERHYAENGSYAAWVRSLDVNPSSPDVRVTLLRGGQDEWEAVADHPIGLTCTQEGRVEKGVARSDRPVCFTTQP